MPQTEIKETLPAIDELGQPQNFGWARFPNFVYNQSLIRASRRRISECDRYILVSPTNLVIFEILDDGALGYLVITVASLKDKDCSSQTFLTPFSMGSFLLPMDSDSNSVKFRKKKIFINFANMEGGIRIIKVDVPNFSHHMSLRGEVVLTPPPDAESIVTHMPWRGKGNAFSCYRRSPWYSAEGVIQFGGSELIFTKGNGWGILDWHRGLRPRSDLRFWASACGQTGDHQAGFSVGYNSADSAFGTENAFFLDGRIHKLDQVSFHIPSGRIVPWRFTSNNNRLEMTFTPQQESDDSHQLFFYSLKRRQLYGSFSGKVILDDGSAFEFQDIAGIAERRKSSF